ncbi:hypothetical protein CSC62_12285 [Pseudoxanthomonas jiangsuensis]|uniref:outer membrane protein transport protein n=1 Tax=Pseudoxanthomonas jiangsuensis TaxID=619688 RepID=UPI0013907CAC|nr:outer membrane protein transport protein [Pseudoxanthomonas jiangsuensis]KAF1694242.1 hypothetical protein CSC62_12285 [Pseudoxanthomonas jiangsuensis]
MHPAHSITRISALALGIVGALACGHAHAAASQLKENSAKGLGRAFAGSGSAAGDASIIVNTPAGMRQLDGRQLQADLSAVSFSAEFTGAGRNAGPTGPGTGTPISGGNGGDAGKIAAIPAAYFYTPVGEQAHLGVSLSVPYGFATEYDSDWVGRYGGTKTEMEVVDLGLSASYDVNPYVSFGASVFAEHMTIELGNAIDFGAILASARVPGYAPGSADGSLKVEGDNNAWGWTVGGLFSPDENTHIGLSYRSKVEHKITGGDATFVVPQQAAAILSVARPGWFVDTSGKATVTLPASATLSVTHVVNDQWTVMADVTRTAWSTAFDSVTIDYASSQADSVLNFDYRDTTFGSIGAEYKLNQNLTLRGGLAYDQTPTTAEHRDVRVPDTTRKWVTLGLGYAPSEKMEFNLGYLHIFASDPTVTKASETGNLVNGKYDVVGDVLAASINYKF